MKFNKYKNIYNGKKFYVSICMDMSDLSILPAINIAFEEKFLEVAWLFFGFGVVKK